MSGSQAKYGHLLNDHETARAELDLYILRRLTRVAEQVRGIVEKKQVLVPPSLSWVQMRTPWTILTANDDAVTMLEIQELGHDGTAQVRYHHVAREWLYLSTWEVSSRTRALLENTEENRARQALRRREAAAQRRRTKVRKMEIDLQAERAAYRAVVREVEALRSDVTHQ